MFLFCATTLVDAIYEEALATREAYCSSLISTASALQASRSNSGVRSGIGQPLAKQQDALRTTPAAMEERRPQTVDACVNTDDIKSDLPPQTAAPAAPVPQKKAQKKEEPKPPPPEEDDSSSDVLSVMIAMLFSTIFSLLWFVFVGLPLKMVKFTFLISVAAFVLSALWLFLADDHGAQAMGARIDYGFNPQMF